jgi:hypothetical protein
MIDNNEDIIDSREIDERLQELEDDFLSWTEENADDIARAVTDVEDYENYDELVSLRALVEEGQDYGDWSYGTTLIRETYFTEYCRQMCEDNGEIPRDLPSYIASHIDWDGVAGEIMADIYMPLDYNGVNYYILCI